MVERVVVAVDGGPASDAALAWAIDRAETVDLALEITTIVGADGQLPGGAEVDYRTPHELTVHGAASTVTSAIPDLAVTTRIRVGAAAASLVRASAHVDLLVIGTNTSALTGGSGRRTMPLKVAGRASCITVVVPAKAAPTGGHVVVGWNNDPIADRALEFAAGEAERRRVELLIVHTWSPPIGESMDSVAPSAVANDLSAANHRLADATRRIRLDHPSLKLRQVVNAGSAAVAIIHAASGASLVVVGSRGRGAVAGLLLGSVSRDVLLNMPAPVAIVPASRRSAHQREAVLLQADSAKAPAPGALPGPREPVIERG